MSTFHPPDRIGVVRFLAAGVCALLVGCSSSTAPSPDTATTYTAKGRLEAIKPAANGHGFLDIKHEPVPSFKDEKGKVVGMGVMTMAFAHGPEIDPSALTVGGPVKMVFVMDYAARPMLFIKSIEALPKGSPLAF